MKYCKVGKCNICKKDNLLYSCCFCGKQTCDSCLIVDVCLNCDDTPIEEDEVTVAKS